MTELLKSVIWQLGDSYRKRRGKRGDGSTGGHDVHELKRAGIRELVKNEHVIELAELPNTPDRR
ncbi:hypothetical protein CW713_08480 [Methanophagales archaeon]|nr:MAG: hypothetical protein CW713_08480 [Methanophagales archaeon]